MDIQAQRERLNTVIRERAIRYGDFVLRSGAHSSFYLDCRQVTLDSEGAFLVASLMLARMQGMDAQAVGGPALGAVPIVGAICAIAHTQGRTLSGFIVRKEAKDHGMGNLVEGELQPGARVVVVEDTVTTGGELLRAVEAVRERGCVIALAIWIVDRGAGALQLLRDRGIPAEALYTLSDLGVRYG
jgi:orotate phosphoribosyltransferase